MFLYKTQSSANSRTDDLIVSGRSLMKIRNRTGPKTDPCGTPDRMLSLMQRKSNFDVKINKVNGP